MQDLPIPADMYFDDCKDEILEYEVKKDDVVIGKYRGLPTHHQNCISFLMKDHPAIAVGCTLCTVDGLEEYQVIDIAYGRYKQTVELLNAHYQPKKKSSSNEKSVNTTFNINAAYGSIIGNENQATIHYDATIETLKDKVALSQSADKEELQKIVPLLEQIVHNQRPVTQGMFANFRNVMERNSWFTGSVMNALLNWMLSKIG